MRIGIFGGTFDPIHLAHLVIAEHAREQARLDEVWFMPAAQPPHKSSEALTPFDRRADMIELAIAGHPAFRLERIESERAGPSYTADTLDELRKRHPQARFHLIIGSDCLPDLPTWHQPRRIVAAAKLVVAARPGWPVWPVGRLRTELKVPAAATLEMEVVHVPQIDIASRDLRRQVAQGKSIRYMVPSGVLAYIEDKKLYK